MDTKMLNINQPHIKIVIGAHFIRLTYALRPTNILPYVYTINIKVNTMSEKNQQLTSVKLDKDLFEQFRVECIKRKFSFQKLSERAIHLYLTDDEFKRQIHNHNDLSLEEQN
jgi:hypothetical protein